MEIETDLSRTREFLNTIGVKYTEYDEIAHIWGDNNRMKDINTIMICIENETREVDPNDPGFTYDVLRNYRGYLAIYFSKDDERFLYFSPLGE